MFRSLHLLPLLLLLQACGSAGLPEVIYIARHGQTEWNRQARLQGDPDLDPVGYINRFSLWQLLKDRPLGAIYTSQRLRTRRTAELLAREHNLPLEEREALNEISSGVLEGICFSQTAPARARPTDRVCEVPARGSHPEATLGAIQAIQARAAAERLNGRYPQGENYHDLATRAGRFVEELERGFSRREVLVVGHGVINRVLLHHLMGWPLEQVAFLRQENDQVYRLERWPGQAPRLSLYTPGTGWRQCEGSPAPGARHLSCNPHRAPSGRARAMEPPPAPPASQPAAPTAAP